MTKEETLKLLSRKTLRGYLRTEGLQLTDIEHNYNKRGELCLSLRSMLEKVGTHKTLIDILRQYSDKTRKLKIEKSYPERFILVDKEEDYGEK